MDMKMLDAISYIGEKLNKEEIVWGIGASILLNQYGLVGKPNDIDILVDLAHIKKADMILSSIGVKKNREKSDDYSTLYFYEYVVNGIDVDVMSGVRIKHNSGTFDYTFDRSSVTEMKRINDEAIPLTSLEDWFVLYQVIPNREEKAAMLEKYLSANGIKHPALLERALKGELPEEVKQRILRLLSGGNPLV